MTQRLKVLAVLIEDPCPMLVAENHLLPMCEGILCPLWVLHLCTQTHVDT